MLEVARFTSSVGCGPGDTVYSWIAWFCSCLSPDCATAATMVIPASAVGSMYTGTTSTLTPAGIALG
ncbi:unannotated protein [freshwater metagenome]|uniref:Unannotated protein n=1 Tax=freshwater metagenome TaxID=449393 RepID=A0A6J5YL95_9ZZZZ